jgi:phosphoribosylanthranilate isomerase
MVRVKICGITNLDDALASIKAGADALGFNFYQQSPRYIEPLAAREIIQQLPASILCVGVFVNLPNPDQVKLQAREAGVQAVQLHGDESPAYSRELKDLFVIKALRVGRDFDPEQAAGYETDAVLLDGFSPVVFGGAGQTFDWSIAIRTRPLVDKLFLAGGLTENNVAAAVESVQPYAVDACSGIERIPGRKDIGKVRAFIAAVRGAGFQEQ